MSKMTPEQIAKSFLGLSPSMEENDLNININAEHEGEQVDEDAVPLDTSDAPEAAELDVADSIADVEEETEAADEVADAVESLEHLQIALESLQEQGAEFTPAAAMLTQVAVDNALSRMGGLTAETIGVPSMEDFGYAPESSITVSVEKIGDAISGGLQAAGAFIKKIWEKIKQFFTRMFDAAKGGVMKVEAIEKQLDALPSGVSVANGATVTLPAIVGPVLTAKPVNDALAILKQINTSAVSASDVATFVGVVAGDMNSDNDARRKQMIDAFNNGLEKLGGKNYPFGNIAFKAEAGKVVSVTAGGNSESKTVDVPSVQQLKDIAKANHSLLNELVDIRKQEGRHKKLNETMAKVSEKAVQFQTRKADDDVKDMARGIAGLASAATTMYNQRVTFELNVIGKMLSAANALNNVLAAGTAQYAKAAKK